MAEQLYVGLDLGTTSTKACAFDGTGKLVACVSADYALRSPEPQAAELDALEVLSAARTALIDLRRSVTSHQRERSTLPWAGIGLSTAMHSLLLLDDKFQPISPLYTYADGRAQSVLGTIDADLAKRLLRETGTPVHPMSPLLKLRWLKQEKPALFERAAYFADLKSYLLQQWSDAGLALDYGVASATGLFDLESRDWHPAALDWAGVSADRLPRLVPPGESFLPRQELAHLLVDEDIPLIAGGSDGCLANFGSDLLDGPAAAVTVGTSGAVRVTHQNSRLKDGEHMLFNYLLFDDYYVCGGATNNGGKLLDWAFHTFAHGYADIGELLEAALAIDLPTLSFRPFLYGERAPVWDSKATAAFEGLRANHGPLEMTRAIVEGLTENLVTILRQVEATTGQVERLVVSGGLSQNKAWRDLLAKKSERKVEAAGTEQASAHGAAMLVKRMLG